MGIVIALIVILLWLGSLYSNLAWSNVEFHSPVFYITLLLQIHLYTGLFITAHDAMHGTVSKNKLLNKAIGYMATFLYAGMSYNRLIKNHFKHHSKPGTADDPDFNASTQNFFIWWGSFMVRYTTIPQLIVMALTYNILKVWVSEINLWFFWIIPAFLSSIQLFYFGTYLPHRKPHTHEMEPHKARTQNKNHLWAFISCYFFGYHFEHHQTPRIPWWQLYKTK